MKKNKIWTTIVVVLVLCITTAITAFATNDTTSYVSSSAEVSRGEEITFSVGISNGTAVRSILIIPVYDSNAFELIAGSWTLSGGSMKDFSVSSGDGVILFDPGIDVNGTVLTFTLKAKSGATLGTQSVSADIVITDSNGNSTLTTNPATVQVKCNHSFTKEDTTYLKSEATCNSPAVYYKSCAICGEKGTETFEHGATAEHSYTKQVTTDAYKKSSASCTAKAVYYYCCATCDAKGTETYESGSTLAHNYTRKVVTDTYKKSAATCTDAAVYYYCCATCDAKGTTTYTNGAELGHTGGTATCTEKAECSRCHELYGTMPEHVYTDQDATATYLKSAATCTSKAVYYKNCATCDKAGTATFEYGSTEPHAYTKQVTTDAYKKSDASCTAKAVYYYCCATCDAKGTNTFEHGTTLSHNYTRKVVTDTYKKSAATCTDAAVYYYCCATCDAKGTTTYTNGSELGHTGGTATCTAKAECTRCHQPYGNMLEHVYTDQDATAAYLKSAATCTSKAIYYKNCATCDKAGMATFEYGSTEPHAYTRKVTTDTYKKSSASCTAKAVYYYCCATCDAKGTTTYEDGTTLAHSYTRQVITDAYKVSDADCDSKAVYNYCCATCDAKGTTTFEYGSVLGHTGGTATCTAKAICTRCSQEYGKTLDHIYNQEVAQDQYLASAASCTAKAKYYKSCSCGAKGEVTFEVGEKKAHTYTEKVDALYLKSAATCTAKAVYYESCSVCGEKGTTTFETGDAPRHNYKTTWNSDSTSHWHECSKCGDKKDSTSHTAGAAATEYTAQTCTVCGYVITPALGHTHHYSTTWSKDADTHWYDCTGCSTPKDKATHDYTNACDTDCNTCGYVREITHAYKTEWSKDAEKHWYECSVCGDKKNETIHTPGADATETTDQTCTVCGYVIREALGHTHNHNTMKNDETNHWNECACGDKTGITAHTWDDGVVTKEATYDEEGEKTFTCSTCFKTKIESVEKLVRDDDTNTDTEGSADVPADTDKDTDATEHPSGGCRSAIGIGAGSIVVIAMICCAVIFLKKKKA